MGREMYCVRRGLVEVVGDDEVTVVATHGPGAYFGEVCMLVSLNLIYKGKCQEDLVSFQKLPKRSCVNINVKIKGKFCYKLPP